MAITHAVPEVDRLDRRDLKAYPKETQDILMELVNRYHVGFKHKDGNHLFLYSPDGVSRPRKVSASRPGPQQEKLLLQWAKEHLTPEQVHEKDVLQLAQVLNSPERPIDELHARKTGQRIPVTTQTESTDGFVLDEGWTRYVKSNGDVSTWETDGKQFRCLKCKAEDKEFITDAKVKLGGHVRAYHSIGFDHLKTPEAMARSKAARHAARVEETKVPAEVVEPEAEAEAVEPAEPEVAEVKVEAEETKPTKATSSRSQLVSVPALDQNWQPYLNTDGSTSGWLVNDAGQYKCLSCLADNIEFIIENKASRAGHVRTRHMDTSSMYGPEAQEKKRQTREANVLRAKIAEAVDFLLEATGEVKSDPAEIKELKAQIRGLERQIVKLGKDHEKALTKAQVAMDKATKRAEDAEAKMELLKEAFTKL